MEKELIEKLAVVLDRLDRIERKLDEQTKEIEKVKSVKNTETIPFYPQITWTNDKTSPFDWTKITCDADMVNPSATRITLYDND